MPQTENIGDLLLQQLNDPQKMQQLGQMLSSLGLGGPANAQTNAQQTSSEPNLSALLSALQQQMENGSSGQNQPSQAPAGANLSALLSTLQQQMENGSKGNSASDLSALLLALQQGAAQNGTNSAGQAPSGADLSSLLSALQGSQSGANAPAISMDTRIEIPKSSSTVTKPPEGDRSFMSGDLLLGALTADFVDAVLNLTDLLLNAVQLVADQILDLPAQLRPRLGRKKHRERRSENHAAHERCNDDACVFHDGICFKPRQELQSPGQKATFGT